jgi:hypothetical protein
MIIDLFLAVAIASLPLAQQTAYGGGDSEKTYFVRRVGADTVIFANVDEGSMLMKKFGVGVGFFRKDRANITRILSLDLRDVSNIKYYIDDFNDDGINEVLVVDGDEAYFGVTIYSVVKSGHGQAVKTLFKKRVGDCARLLRWRRFPTSGNLANGWEDRSCDDEHIWKRQRDPLVCLKI